MRTKLLLALILFSIGLTGAILMVVRTALQDRIREQLAADLHGSVSTYFNFQDQRRQMLLHDTELLADLPSLKALMSSADPRTIRDGGTEFWNLSGSDLLALLGPAGDPIAIYNRGAYLDPIAAKAALREISANSQDSLYLLVGGRLYEISIRPLYFGPIANGTRLGYVVGGHEIDLDQARKVGEVAMAQVAFLAAGRIVTSTLSPARQADLVNALPHLAQLSPRGGDIWLGREHFLVAVAPLAEGNRAPVELIVLKSFDRAQSYLRMLNRRILLLGLIVIAAEGLLALYFARSITRPLESFAAGALAFGAGDFSQEFPKHGAREIQELGTAFERMRLELRQTQQELLKSERLAVIGRMASSISHDLRHHLSAIYANAEFLGAPGAGGGDRVEFLGEIRAAVDDMTNMIESLLVFSRTGETLHCRAASLPAAVEHVLSIVKLHPDAANVKLLLDAPLELEAWMDVKKIERAIYNLVLNACQAASRAEKPLVRVSVREDALLARVRIEDNGPGVADSIRMTLFEPFVSEGKQNGIGLGLSLAQRIAQEHMGGVALDESAPGATVFILSIAKDPRNAGGPQASFTGGSWAALKGAV